jgi:hypothetical protein
VAGIWRLDAFVQKRQGLGELIVWVMAETESDCRVAMHKQIYRKFFFHFSIFGIALSVLTGFYDVIFHFIFECIHLFMELLEEILDSVIEKSFNTELHETQLIVFYILLVFGGFMVFLLWKILASAFDKTGKLLGADWLELKTSAAADWQNLSTPQKVIGVGVLIGVNLVILSFVMCCMF